MTTSKNDSRIKSNDDDDDDRGGGGGAGMLSSWTTWFDELSDRQRLDRLRSCSELDRVLKSCQEEARRQQRREQLKDQKKQKQQQQQETKSSRWPSWRKRSYQPRLEKENAAGSNTQVGNNNNDNDDESHVDLIERTSQGIRSMKYFGWRGVLSSLGSNSTTSDNDMDKESKFDGGSNSDSDARNNTRIRQSCSREQHAVWACRAVATGCGHDLSLLKTCFESGSGSGGGDDGSNDQQQHGTPPTRTQTASPTFSSVDILTTPHTAYHLGGGGGGSMNKKKNTMNIPCYGQQVQLGQCVTTQAQALLERKRRREEDETQRQK